MVGLASLSAGTSSAGSGEKRTFAYLYAMNEDGSSFIGTPEVDSEIQIQPPIKFQYFPESITDSLKVNYATINVPGSTVPIFQWISTGGRVISFQAVLSSDTEFINLDGTKKDRLIERQRNVGIEERNVDIRSYLGALRSYMLPQYIKEGGSDTALSMPKAPRSCFLYMKNSGIGYAGGLGDHPDQVPAKMLSCSITHQSFFPSGLPRYTTVSLSFGQTGQFGDQVKFSGYDANFQKRMLPDSDTYRGVLRYARNG